MAHRALMNTMNSQQGLPVLASYSVWAHSHWGALAGPAAGHVASCRPAPLAMRPPRGPPGDGLPRGRERRAWSVAAVEGRAQGSSGWRPGGRGAAGASGSNPSAARRSAAPPSSASGGDLSQNGPLVPWMGGTVVCSRREAVRPHRPLQPAPPASRTVVVLRSQPHRSRSSALTSEVPELPKRNGSRRPRVTTPGLKTNAVSRATGTQRRPTWTAARGPETIPSSRGLATRGSATATPLAKARGCSGRPAGCTVLPPRLPAW